MVSAEQAAAFWSDMRALERAHGDPFRVAARFDNDTRRATPIDIVLEGGEPRAIVSDELAALRNKIDPRQIASLNRNESGGQHWREAFESARTTRRLTLDDVCNLVLGPIYFPERAVHDYTADKELRVRVGDVRRWLPALIGDDDYEYSLSELYEEHTPVNVPSVRPSPPPKPVDAPKAVDHPVPTGWHSARLNLSRAAVQAQVRVGQLDIPDQLLDQACAALSAGKHLLLIGPPGTGKTELAECLSKAAQAEGYSAGLFSSTASADWTTFETIGGYALQKDGGLNFRPGVFLRALEQYQWLLIDEINRADIDKAFGELMTVLSGKAADTPYVGANNRTIGIGPDGTRSHVMPKTFRVIATMNIWDKTSLFRLSYAVQRRFAIIHVGHPSPDTYAALLRKVATEGQEPRPLPEVDILRIIQLFGPKQLLRSRPVGAAIPMDMIRYMRCREAAALGFAEALAMYLLPQLEGIEPKGAEELWKFLALAIHREGSEAPEAADYLRARFQEIFPQARLDKAGS